MIVMENKSLINSDMKMQEVLKTQIWFEPFAAHNTSECKRSRVLRGLDGLSENRRRVNTVKGEGEFENPITGVRTRTGDTVILISPSPFTSFTTVRKEKKEIYTGTLMIVRRKDDNKWAKSYAFWVVMTVLTTRKAYLFEHRTHVNGYEQACIRCSEQRLRHIRQPCEMHGYDDCQASCHASTLCNFYQNGESLSPDNERTQSVACVLSADHLDDVYAIGDFRDVGIVFAIRHRCDDVASHAADDDGAWVERWWKGRQKHGGAIVLDDGTCGVWNGRNGHL